MLFECKILCAIPFSCKQFLYNLGNKNITWLCSSGIRHIKQDDISDIVIGVSFFVFSTISCFMSGVVFIYSWKNKIVQCIRKREYKEIPSDNDLELTELTRNNSFKPTTG